MIQEQIRTLVHFFSSKLWTGGR